MKRVALINPKGNIFGCNKEMNHFLTSTKSMESFRYLWAGPNLALITIASILPDDWDCVYIDQNYIDIDFDQQYDIVIISSMTQQIRNAYDISERFRHIGALTIIGGIHVTLMPEEALQYADVVNVGEAEKIFPQLIDDIEHGCVKRIYKEVEPEGYEFIDSPMPRFDLLKEYSYSIITLQTTRGCPHDCSFCSASKVFGTKYRRKENYKVLQELERILDLYPDKIVLFADDNMFVMKKQVKELLKQMCDMNFRWIAQTDISIAEDDELLELMVHAGCQWVVIGFESISSKSLKNIDKNNWKFNKLPKYKTSIQKIQNYGIGVYGTFIVGLDEDDISIFKNTSEFIIKNKLYGCNITVPTPLPGTRLREHLLKDNRIAVHDWNYYTFWDVTIIPQRMTKEELENGLLSIYQNISINEEADKRLIYLRQLMKRREAIKRSVI